ncbi:ankyrin repeat domain-containing protein [Endozoicomonas atrinae]|uniref:ankyrin repeat domain-containing protein n=1 Tax=Endozoicomonas atrinae TaxID=1333660 RepID=UPI001112F42A|nr:ankyrin repeat domain-containing protein [Endozoicomonas atrinae]
MPRHKSNQLLNTFFSFAKKLDLPLFQKNRSGDTPLHLAIENAQTEVAMTLILYARKEELTITNRTGQMAIHLALAHEARPIAFSILYRNSSKDILLEEQAKWMDTIMHTPEAILNRRHQLSSDTKEQTDKPKTQLTSAFHQSLPPKLPETHLKTE